MTFINEFVAELREHDREELNFALIWWAKVIFGVAILVPLLFHWFAPLMGW